MYNLNFAFILSRIQLCLMLLGIGLRKSHWNSKSGFSSGLFFVQVRLFLRNFLQREISTLHQFSIELEPIHREIEPINFIIWKCGFLKLDLFNQNLLFLILKLQLFYCDGFLRNLFVARHHLLQLGVLGFFTPINLEQLFYHNPSIQVLN